MEIQPIDIRNHAIGRVKGEGIIKIDWHLRREQRTMVTVEHEEARGYWRFSASATAWLRINSSDCHSGGQIIDLVSRLETPLSRRIVKVWSAYHLNDVTAACVHMGPAATLGDTCPESGYGYGTAWLLKPIPEEALAEIASIAEEIKTL